MTAQDPGSTLNPSRSRRLMKATAETHIRLENAIRAVAAFDSRERYTRFLIVQRAFYRDIDALYLTPALAGVLPDLPERSRLGLIEEDLSDVGEAAVSVDHQPVFRHDEPVEIPNALGWLFVAEGSNLGAAALLKKASKLGLGERFGARHLAPRPGGRGRSWGTFAEAFDAVALGSREEKSVVDGATNAFERFETLVEKVYRQ